MNYIDRANDYAIKPEAVTYRLVVGYEIEPVRGNAIASGDDALDKQVEDEILAHLDDGDVWAWAEVRVEATVEGLPFRGKDALGCCCYANEKDFRASGYFESMCAEAFADLEKQARRTRLLLAEVAV